MPHRLVSVAILLLWAVAAGLLLRRDVLPLLLVGPPPDMRAIARAGEAPGPVRWTILITDETAPPGSFRSVGTVVTESKAVRDGWTELTSDARIDAGGLMKRTPWARAEAERLRVVSDFEIDPSGNLFQFRVSIRSDRERDELMTIDGRLHDNALDVRAHSPVLPFLNWGRTFPYQARGMVQNTLGPVDRMPGLHVGQRWESRIVSPLSVTGQMEVVKVEVPAYRTIHWGRGPVRTLEVVMHFASLSARIWVRPDGLVLRQEVPTPFGRLLLERQAERADRDQPEDDVLGAPPR
jgi:hypothetical protein